MAGPYVHRSLAAATTPFECWFPNAMVVDIENGWSSDTADKVVVFALAVVD